MRIKEAYPELWGREKEKQIIEAALSNLPQHDRAIYYFHGPSGVGKSTLWRYARNIAKEKCAIYISEEIRKEGVMSSERGVIRTLYNYLRVKSSLPSKARKKVIAQIEELW